jgi:Ni,Fe-hydrogenase I small subunit
LASRVVIGVDAGIGVGVFIVACRIAVTCGTRHVATLPGRRAQIVVAAGACSAFSPAAAAAVNGARALTLLKPQHHVRLCVEPVREESAH